MLDPIKNTQNFIIEHHDDITCLDVVGDTVVTGEAGANPEIIVWDSVPGASGTLTKQMIITE